MNKPHPIRLRPAIENRIGTTAFFRNRPLYETIFQELLASGKSEFKIIFHASSIGAEVYSFIIEYLANNYNEFFNITCYATDIEQHFLNFSKAGIYPIQILQGMTPLEQSFFSTDEQNAVVSDKVKNHLTFLPASSFTDFVSNDTYDIVFLLNALIYVPEEQQSLTIDKISNYNSKWFITSAFHRETIKSDLIRNEYYPIINNIELIHNSWLDRRVNTTINEKRNGIYADWSLPEYSEIEDYEYKYCAIFKKTKCP